VGVVVGDNRDTAGVLDAIAELAGRGIAPILLTNDASPGLRYQAYRSGACFVLSASGELSDLPSALAAASVLPRAPAATVRDEGGGALSPASDLATVLVIDDTATNRELAARQLFRVGLACDSAENGHIGLEMTAARQYALILVDGSMPV